MSIVFSSVFWILQAMLVLYLSFQFGVWLGLTTFAVISVGGTLLGGWLLAQSEIGEITWRNRIAGALLPWATFVGGGTLTGLMVKNAVASVVYGIVVVACERMGIGKALFTGIVEPSSTQSSWWILLLTWMTVACWIVAVIGWLWVLKSYIVHQPERISQLLMHRNHWISLLLPPLATIFSMLLWNAGQKLAAFLVVAIPLLVVLLPVILLASVLLGFMLMGKPTRWN